MRCYGQLQHLKVKIFLLFLLIFSLSYGETVITLKKYVNTDKTQIKLSDIATIRADTPSIKSFLSQIIVINNLNGTVKIYPKNIKQILQQNYIDISKIRIIGNYTLISKNTPYINTKKIQQDIINYIKSRYPDYQIQQIKFSHFEKKFPYQVQIKIVERNKTSSYMYLTYQILRNGQLIKSINVSVKYIPFAKVVVADRDIMKGQLISKDDIRIEKVKFRRGYITDPNIVIGAIAKVFIQKDKPIRENMIEPDYPVKKRSYVKVVYDRNGIKIEITGYALENGQKGQVIKVKNPSTGKILPCKVIGENTVLFIGGSR